MTAKERHPGAGSAGSGIHNVILGTAGHIDHGKTALVQRLTGINADRLPEEQERGMTIDLGFARYDLANGRRVGLIDVPGHERFIKNTVAGASGIDLVLLVVAADDGVMPQTREHLEIMELLGIRHGIVVVTKIDLVDPDLLELAIEDIRDAVRGTFLETAPVCPVSSISGKGFEKFVETLQTRIAEIEPRASDGIFRMPIQRVFSAKGFGTVLTGVPIAGTAGLGDTLEVLPLGKTGRVRGIQAYLSQAEIARAGQSSALNLSDLDYKEVERGMVLVAPGHFEYSALLEVRLNYLWSNTRPLKHSTSVRFHCGTAETLGVVYLLENKVLEPGQSALAQLRLESPTVVVPGDRFVLRLHSPMITIGGGEVLSLSRWRLKFGKSFVIDHLTAKEEALGSPLLLVQNAIEEKGFESVPLKEAARGSGLPEETVQSLIEELIESGEVLPSRRAGQVLSRKSLDRAREVATKAAESFFAANPRRLLMEKTALRQAVTAEESFFQELLKSLEDQGLLEPVSGEHLRWAFHSPRLSEAESQFKEALMGALQDQAFTPPSIEDVAAEARLDAKAALSIAELLIEEGLLVRIGDLHFAVSAIDDARQRLRDFLEKKGSMTASEAKNVLDSSRKYMIPLLEYFDQEGFTVRRGDVRELRSGG